MKADVYTITGDKKETAELPADIFGLPWNADLVHQVTVGFQANKRQSIAHAKGRHEVRGGGAKPWKQKGTGRARHGSVRSPIWIGGGVTHGPLKEKDYSKKVNKKMATKALLTVLSRKFSDGEIIFLDSLQLSEGKSKEAVSVVDALSKIKGFEMISRKKGNAALISLGESKDGIRRGFKNISTIAVDNIENLNALDALNYKYIVITDPEKSFEFLKSKTK